MGKNAQIRIFVQNLILRKRGAILPGKISRKLLLRGNLCLHSDHPALEVLFYYRIIMSLLPPSCNTNFFLYAVFAWNLRQFFRAIFSLFFVELAHCLIANFAWNLRQTQFVHIPHFYAQHIWAEFYEKLEISDGNIT